MCSSYRIRCVCVGPEFTAKYVRNQAKYAKIRDKIHIFCTVSLY